MTARIGQTVCRRPPGANTRHNKPTKAERPTKQGGTNANAISDLRRGHSRLRNRLPIAQVRRRSDRKRDRGSTAIRKQEEANQEGARKMSLDRRPLFSVHTNDEGRIALYLEEQDAVLDLLEEAGNEANGDYIAALTQAGEGIKISTDTGWLEYERMRQLLPATVLLIAQMSENEALDLAQDIVRNVAARRSPRLELVK